MITDPRIAVIGCGYWGKNLVRNFAQLRVLSVICDEDEKILNAQATLYPQVRATTRFGEVLEDPAVHGIVIATPAAMYYEEAKAALQAGKYVFVEKPLSLQHDHGAELVELSQKTGLTLMVGHILEYHPAVTLLKDLILLKELGRIPTPIRIDSISARSGRWKTFCGVLRRTTSR